MTVTLISKEDLIKRGLIKVEGPPPTPAERHSPRPKSKKQAGLRPKPIMDGEKKAPLVDICCNLTAFKEEKISAVLKRAAEAGVTHIIVTGTTYNNSKRALRICETFDRTEGIVLRCTIGIHPCDVFSTLFKVDEETKEVRRTKLGETYEAALENLVKSDLGRRYCVAIGECGLDYNRSAEHAQYQRPVFANHLKLAHKVNLPVLLHCRDAHMDFMKILRAWMGVLKVVDQCHTDPSVKNLKELLAGGCYIGLTGIVTDERDGRFNPDVAAEIPEDRLMVETDAPYLFPRNTPNSMRSGCRNNEPCLLPYVVKKISHLTDRPEREIAHSSTEVAKGFFKLS